METERMLNELIAIKEKENGKQYSTLSLNIYDMVTDIIPKIDKLNKIEEIEACIGIPILDFMKIFMSDSIIIYSIEYMYVQEGNNVIYKPVEITNLEYRLENIMHYINGNIQFSLLGNDCNIYTFFSNEYKINWFITEQDAVERFSFFIDEYKNSIKDV